MLAGTAVTNLSQYAESSGVRTGTGTIQGSRGEDAADGAHHGLVGERFRPPAS